MKCLRVENANDDKGCVLFEMGKDTSYWLSGVAGLTCSRELLDSNLRGRPSRENALVVDTRSPSAVSTGGPRPHASDLAGCAGRMAMGSSFRRSWSSPLRAQNSDASLSIAVIIVESLLDLRLNYRSFYLCFVVF